MKRYFDRRPQQESKQDSVSLPEHYEPDFLLQQIRTNQKLFRSPTTTEEKQLQALKPEQRMEFILTKLAHIESFVQHPPHRELRSIQRLPAQIEKNIRRHIHPQILQQEQSADRLASLMSGIEFQVQWLQTPAIYDFRSSHSERRVWRDQMIAVFDHGSGRQAKGPFNDFYNQNIITPNFSMPAYQIPIAINLKALGLEHPSTISDLAQLKELSKQLAQMPQESVQERVDLIWKKIRPLIRSILQKLAKRPFQQVEPQLPEQKGVKNRTQSEKTDDRGPAPDWLNTPDEDDRDFDWSQVLGE